MKRCEKYGFKTGKEMVKDFNEKGINLYPEKSLGFCTADREAKCKPISCKECLINYLNEEIETNFEHYLKEYIKTMQNYTVKQLLSCSHLCNFSSYIVAKHSERRDRSIEFKEWLNEECKP